MNAKPYPKYKPSGVAWLGDLPAHWTIKGAALGFEIQLGKMLQPDAGDVDDIEVPYLKSQHVQWERVRVEESPQMWASPRDIKKYGVVDGDLLVCEGGDVGRAAIVRQPDDRTIIQNALHRVRACGKNDVRFLLRVLEHAAAQDWFSILCNRSTIAHFTAEKFGALRVPFPPFEEQQTIADFLANRTAKLDALLKKKRSLIGKLKEKRSALISRTVTKGLPSEAAAQAGLTPNPKLKYSGVPWLGDIPKHWPLKRLSEICKFDSGKAHEPFIDEDGEYVCVNARFVSTSGITRKLCSENFCPAERNDILMVMSDLPNGRALAKAYLVGQDEKLAVNQRVCRLRTFGDDPKFLYYSLDRNPGLLRFNDGVSQTHLSNSNYKKLDLPMPSLNEQTYIVAYLDAETAKIDRMIGKVEIAIEKLTEYRTALITAAVTGKIDIR